MLHGVLAEKKDRRAEVVIVNRFVGVQLNGLRVIIKRLGHRTVVAVIVGEIVPDRRVRRIQRARLFQLIEFAVLVADIAEKNRISDADAGVFGMPRDEIIVGLADRLEALADAIVQCGGGDTRALGDKFLVLANPFVHLGL